MMLIGVLHANFVPTLMAGVGHTMERLSLTDLNPISLQVNLINYLTDQHCSFIIRLGSAIQTV